MKGIGVVIVGYGHPDLETGPGPAPLPGTNHAQRLMCSGTGYQSIRGNLLVKKEWDEAEQWLNEFIKDQPE